MDSDVWATANISQGAFDDLAAELAVSVGERPCCQGAGRGASRCECRTLKCSANRSCDGCDAGRPPRGGPPAREAIVQTRVPAVFMRGGTSRAIMFHERDLAPYSEAERTAIILAAMGS